MTQMTDEELQVLSDGFEDRVAEMLEGERGKALEAPPVWHDRIFTIHGKDANIDWEAIRTHGAYTVVSPEVARVCKTQPVPKFSIQRNPGFGDTDWKQVLTELRLVSYQGSIDIEGWHDRTFKGDLEMTGQVASLNYLKTCRGGDYTPNPEL